MPGAGVLVLDNVPKCYYPDGEETTAPKDYACNLASNASACCSIGTFCLDNGLCQNDKSMETIRGSCTDQTWTSSDCPHYCLDAKFGGTDVISCRNITNSEDFCCDHTNDCCDTGVGRFHFDRPGVPITTIAASASVATRHPSSSSSTPTTPASSTSLASTSVPATAIQSASSPAAQSPAGIITGAAIGIGVGIACGAIALVVAAIWWWRRRHHPRQKSNLMSELLPLEANPHAEPEIRELPGERHHEMQVGNPIWEMPAERSQPGSRR